MNTRRILLVVALTLVAGPASAVTAACSNTALGTGIDRDALAFEAQDGRRTEMPSGERPWLVTSCGGGGRPASDGGGWMPFPSPGDVIPPVPDPGPLDTSIVPDVERPDIPRVAIGQAHVPDTPSVPDPAVAERIPHPDTPAVPVGSVLDVPAPPPSEVPTVDVDASVPGVPGLALPGLFLPSAPAVSAPKLGLPAIGTPTTWQDGVVLGGGWIERAPAYASPAGALPTEAPRTGIHGFGATTVPPTGAQLPGLGGGDAGPSGSDAAAAVARTGLGAALSFAALALYRRLAAPRVLENEVRRRILGHVLAHPAATCAEAARATGVHYVTAERHLRTLAEFGHVSVLRAADGPRYFENHGRYPAESQRDLARLRRPENLAFLRAVAEAPEAGVLDLAATLGLAKSTASRRATILREAGLLEPNGKGFTLTPRAHEAVL